MMKRTNIEIAQIQLLKTINPCTHGRYFHELANAGINLYNERWRANFIEQLDESLREGYNLFIDPNGIGAFGAFVRASTLERMLDYAS